MMKSIIVLFVLTFVLISGCSLNNRTDVEGETEMEIQACSLVKDFHFRDNLIVDFSELKCEFIVENEEEKSIVVSLTHQDFPEREIQMIVLPGENILFRMPDSSKEEIVYRKEGNKFKEIGLEELLDYIE